MRVSTTRADILLLAFLLIPIVSASGQTTGLPFTNDLFVDIGAVGALAGPPGGAPCTAFPPPPPPVAIPPGVPFTITLTTPAPGLFAVIWVVFGPCTPGVFCLPPVAGPYLVLPPPPPGNPCVFTNQSIDIIPAAFALASGFTIGIPGAVGGVFSTPVFIIPPPAPLGLILSLQATFFDPVSGSPILGMVVSNAFDIFI